MYCPYCHAKGVEGNANCPRCGKSLEHVKKESEINCSRCKRDNPTDALYCWFCGEKFEDEKSDITEEKGDNVVHHVSSTTPGISVSTVEIPLLSVIFYVICGLEILGGLILCITLWPDPSELKYGYEYKADAYVPALTWLMAGIISGLLFCAIAEILKYLKKILRHLKRI